MHHQAGVNFENFTDGTPGLTVKPWRTPTLTKI